MLTSSVSVLIFSSYCKMRINFYCNSRQFSSTPNLKISCNFHFDRSYQKSLVVSSPHFLLLLICREIIDKEEKWEVLMSYWTQPSNHPRDQQCRIITTLGFSHCSKRLQSHFRLLLRTWLTLVDDVSSSTAFARQRFNTICSESWRILYFTRTGEC